MTTLVKIVETTTAGCGDNDPLFRQNRSSTILLAKAPDHQPYPVVESEGGNRRARISIQYRDFSNVAKFAEQLLNEHDWIWSIWLFGSRARCEARADSDWDLALITSSYRNGKAVDYSFRSSTIEDIAGPIQCHLIPFRMFMQKRLSRGHVAFAVAGEGVPMAQRNWLLPTHQPFEVFHMDHCSYQHHLMQFAKGLVRTRHIFSHLADPLLRDEWQFSYADLLTISVDLAEGIAKAGCLARDLEKDLCTHNMESLVAELRTLDTDEHFVSLIQNLNGNSERHNPARYLTSPSLRAVKLAFERIFLAFAAASSELRTERDIFQRKGDFEALDIHETQTENIAGFLSRLDQTLNRSEPPRIDSRAIRDDFRQIIHHLWSRKAELVEVTSVLRRGIDEIYRSVENDRER